MVTAFLLYPLAVLQLGPHILRHALHVLTPRKDR